MGGYGSGYRPYPKQVVEQFVTLDINRLARRRLLIPDTTARIDLEHPVTGERVGSAKCMFGPDLGYHMYLTMRLSWGPSRGWREEEEVEADEYVLRLYPSRPHFGGRRWWLGCPFCEERKGKLYLVTKQRGWACRRCGDLTYRSCKEAHQGERALMQAMQLGCMGSD